VSRALSGSGRAGAVLARPAHGQVMPPTDNDDDDAVCSRSGDATHCLLSEQC